MNIQDTWPTTADEFLRWNEGRKGKREFVHGRVVELMINVTKNHWRLTNRLLFQLAGQLGVASFDVGGADFGVRTTAGIRFPDVLVEPGGGDGKALATEEPLLVAEILSPSTMRDDFGPKADDYLAIASLRHYLVLSQDEIRIWLWSRDESGAFGEPVTIGDAGAPVELAGLSATLDLAVLYRGIAAPR